VILWLAACQGSLSNAIFYEDADFLDALPSGEDLAVAYPGDPVVDADDALYFTTTMQTFEGFRNWSLLVTTVSDTIRAVPPAERGEDLRIWGPGVWDAYPGSFLRLEMTRSSDHSLYVWTFQASEMSDGPWTEFMSGVTGDGDWDARLTWDQDALSEAVGAEGSGSLELRYFLHEDATVIDLETRALATTVGTPGDSTAMWFELTPEGAGEFQLAQRMDANPGEAFPIDEYVEIVSRWDDAGVGRGDGQVEGGDYPYPGLVLTQCWTAEGALSYQEDSEGVLPVEGTAADCPYEDVASADAL